MPSTAVDPFVVRTGSQFRTAGPQPLPSAAYAAELDEVKLLGAVNSTTRSTEQTWIARWWQSTPVATWNAVARDLSVRYGMSLVDTARLLAMQNMGGADSSITCWNDKYARDFWRPEKAIARAAEDGNPATEPQPGWLPLIAAPYPEHPSGHLCQDGAHLAILRGFFRDAPRGGYSITSSSTLLPPTDARLRTFTSFSQALTELVEARIWAGLHFRAADVQGEQLGRDVVAFMVANHFQRVRPGR